MSSSLDLPQKVIDYLNESRAPLPPITDPDEPLRIDSLGLLRLLGFLEQELAISVDDEDVDIVNFDTARSLGRLIRVKMEQRSAGQVPDQMTLAPDMGDLVNEDSPVGSEFDSASHFGKTAS